jgi:glycosyltransferase involved in cell wall biosynthesis
MKHIEANPLVSVIVPNYNHARFLQKRLESILEQTFQDYELIVLDDASSDNSLSVIRTTLGDRPYRLITNTKNSGSPCSQWLKGIAEARGTYIWVAESDDTCSDSFLEILLASMEPSVSLAHCRTIPIDEHGKVDSDGTFWPDHIDGQQWQQSFTMEASSFCHHYMLQANCIPNASSALFRKPDWEDLEILKSLTSDKLYAGDWIFWYYLLAASPLNIHFENQAICHFRAHSGTTRNTTTKLREKKRFREYSDAIRYCYVSSRTKGLCEDWRTIAARGNWDWIIDEYRIYYRPSLREKLLISVMHGPLLWAVYVRLLSSRTVFLRLFGLKGKRATLSAKFKHHLRQIAKHSRS